MMTERTRVVVARIGLGLGLGLAAAGCGKEEGPGAAAKAGAAAVVAAAGAAPHPAVAAWKEAGLTVSALTADQSGAIGKDCQSGTVSGVDVVVCRYASAAEASAAEPAALAWVGEATGAALASGTWQLAVVDRRGADPSGRTINQITKIFRDPTAKSK
ncbi:MAG: hypothetical protein KA297_31005 [Kofleriaceae bacterium]|nr:hypothetical protein [Kofleriaceae bacterium]MBP6841882.1 hypothetical protein [Kofleriaceae bacterium]